MRERIINKLNEIEREENIKIIFAVESGSRAWGFDSPDSDYDVRFIYVRSKEDYLRIDKVRDVLEYDIDNLLDIVGWDLSKTLGLLLKANPALFEWINSPIFYIKSDIFEEFFELSKSYYSNKPLAYHYYKMAKHNFDDYVNQRDYVNLKRYLYVFRGLLACKYVIDYNSSPPVLFDELLEIYKHGLDMTIIEELLKAKKVSKEKYIIKYNHYLNTYIIDSFSSIKETLKHMKEEGKKYDLLNQFLLNAIQWHDV